jgi:hypothetical protein
MKSKLSTLGLVLLLGVLVFSGLGSAKEQEQPPVQETISAPTDKESCEALGGHWGRIGLLLEEKCNLPTSDAGEECCDWDDCEGACIAELSLEDLDRAPQGVVYTKGRCSAWRIIVGCHAFVEDGKVYGIMCAD